MDMLEVMKGKVYTIGIFMRYALTFMFSFILNFNQFYGSQIPIICLLIAVLFNVPPQGGAMYNCMIRSVFAYVSNGLQWPLKLKNLGYH